MGYYTNHDLYVTGIENVDQLNRLSEVLTEKNIIDYAISNTATVENPVYYCYDCVKWYDEQQSMIEISKMFPELTFMVYGDGEDAFDYYKNYYHDGIVESCIAKIVFPEPVNIKWDFKEIKSNNDYNVFDYLEDTEEDYTPSSTYGDYGPGNPWDAPGMSVHDFI